MAELFLLVHSMVVISCNNLSKCYRAGFLSQKKQHALSQIFLTIEKGAVYGIIGANGAGKSTLIKILMGLVRQDGGDVRIFGHSPSSPASRKKTGYLPENPNLYLNLSIKDHLHFASAAASRPDKYTPEKINNVLQLVELQGKENIPLKNFSKGMRQRAALAFTLFNDPELLILDEPMSGLDPIGRQLIIDIIAGYKEKGITILFCSHILTDIERVCDTIGIMHQGKLVSTTTPEELLDYKVGEVNGLAKTPLESLFYNTVRTA